jgi:peptide/nickel transport system substrate-binding protein
MPHRRVAARRFLATVLFTDIVGSTQHAARLGDRAWRDVLEKHNAVVRRELKVYGGREMDTAGDGFFAVFEAPERAVRCAASVTSALSPLGLQVRAGLHTGECEMVGGKVGGMAVVIGSRIAALAGPGEVLVSGSVRDLMTGSGVPFEDGEQQTLKGVEDPWRVYRLVPEAVDADTGTSRRASMVPLYTRRQRRRLVVTVAALTAVVLAATGLYVVTRSDPEVVVGENAMGVIGPGRTPRVTAAVPVGRRPTAVAGGFGNVWVTNSATDSVSRIDPEQDVSAEINLDPGSSPSGVAAGAGGVWVANSGDSAVSRIDPATSRVVANIRVRPGPTGIVVAFGSVWVTNALDASVTEINPNTNKVVKVVPVGAGPTGIAAGAGYLWVTNQGDGTVTRFDPKTYVKDQDVKVGSGPVGISVGGGAAWVANNLDGSLWRIDVEDLGVTSRTLAKGGGAYGVAAHDGDVWVSNEYTGTLMRVTARNFRLGATVKLRGAPLGLAFVGDDLWFTSAEGGSAVHRGGILTIVGPGVVFPTGDDPPVLDPTLGYDPATSRLAQLTNDGLVGFRHAGSVQGAGIVPDLATGLPGPTDGGLTYTFHLRRGVRYSTGEAVLAGDIRRGIERTVAHVGSAGYIYYGAIVGGAACVKADDRADASGKPSPDCDLRKGITTDDRTGTIIFHLRKPTPEFVYQLALTSASAVPQRTPLNLSAGSFLPATGPYMIGSYTPQRAATATRPARRGRLELVRNPHFHVWSPAAQPYGYPDRIDLQTGFTDEQGVAQVTNGRADMLWFGAPQADLDTLATRYPSQLHTYAGSFVNYVLLNATKPPFNNLDARRAVAYALDRRRFAAVFSQPETCQLVPPDFPGHSPYCPFTVGGGSDGKWVAPDMDRARKLVRRSGTAGAKVLVVTGRDGHFPAAARQLVKLLRTLGYDASLRPPLSFDKFFDLVADPRNRFHAGLTAWGADYPAASNYPAPLAGCRHRGAGFENFTGYCDAPLDKMISAAYEQQTNDPGGASDSWAAIDKVAVDAAATIPFSTELHQDFVSRRVGNVLDHPVTGPFIAQLWVQ